VYNVTKMIASV